MKTQGKVFLVGAGPGDPELLTIKAAKAIARADVILVDDLVNPAILEHALADARIIPVGKRAGRHSTPQEFIERLMVAEARAGHCVVRLKGGDPFMFGRGGEELECLVQEGIDVEAINGISSGFAAPAAIGVPLTHREWSNGAIFVTGYSKTGERGPDWKKLAKLNMTLVIYMGIASCREIQEALLAGGKSAATPAAVVHSATLDAQMQLVTTLGELPEAMSRARLGSPGIILIGEVVRFAVNGAFAAESDARVVRQHAIDAPHLEALPI
ncbi:uroporphyrinogen-III C-methyltransferase [Noviherbaspirillum cavernae]|uniref:uroporphyrinogen-III C-methyltransferase n=1 Tax=Noviherbaspirillum cavernae TaxID=2320862 RepID=A0A418X3G4_9BURK|nr:uroporphyrinogen-III C-methyltransferase [Noviherbaspirillum cavernae]RJG07004.1 uroporphyrinogen-III C-methyltransferase [Noviherbaspirillum cavernae]